MAPELASALVPTAETTEEVGWICGILAASTDKKRRYRRETEFNRHCTPHASQPPRPEVIGGLDLRQLLPEDYADEHESHPVAGAIS